MRTKVTTAVIALVLLIGALLLTLAMPAGAAAPARAASACATGWGSGPRVVAPLSTAPIDQVRAGRHACYDRLVVDIAGPAGGYSVEYVATVFSEGQGAPLVVPGGARLSVNVHDPLSHVATMTGSPWPVGGRVVDVTGFRTLRSVIFGGEFEGHTQFGVGVRARLPFRVFTLPAAGGRSVLVLDVAHKW